jgi:hypothetical protein
MEARIICLLPHSCGAKTRVGGFSRPAGQRDIAEPHALPHLAAKSCGSPASLLRTPNWPDRWGRQAICFESAQHLGVKAGEAIENVGYDIFVEPKMGNELFDEFELNALA